MEIAKEDVVMLYLNRSHAGKVLAEALAEEIFKDGLVLAIPRGGVVVGVEIARAKECPMDLIIPRKIGAPHNPEVAIGAVTQDGTTIFDRRLLELLGLREEDLSNIVTDEIKEIQRRMNKYRGSSDYPDYAGKRIILVDDGVATGYTVFAALKSIKKIFNPSQLILAIPVSPPDTLELLKAEVDNVICPVVPHDFMAVGQFYEDFGQTSDNEVIQIMSEFFL